MRVWRLSSSLYPPLSGEGARLAGGRWNSPGVPMVYASEHLSLAVLELLVHLNPERLPVNLMAYEIEIPDEAVERFDAGHLRPGWIVDAFYHQTRELGDCWAQEGRSLALVVPSATVSAERNVLINPQHPDAGRLGIASQEPFTFDPRLLR